MNNLESRAWYRALKVFAYVWLFASLIFPWFRLQPTDYSQTMIIIGNILDGLTSVAAWLIVFYVLRKILIYVVFGKQPPQQRPPFRPSENWADFFKAAGITTLALAVGAFLLHWINS
ncbi:MAG: hypothetical protein Q7R90_00450 [bacterium]|nr:hypothetical protein [bacterium]